MDKIEFLKQKVISATTYIPHSRIHALKTFNTTLARCMTKRDDELGFGISGTKWRKYTSLVPYLVQHRYQEACVIGSAYSNHVLGLTQLLIENSITPTLFLLGNPTMKKEGNLLLTSLLVPESQKHWIKRKDWAQVETIASSYMQNKSKSILLIPEGGCVDIALPGALTLALDILKNEDENQEQFEHLFIDAGTGLSAIATILAMAYLGKKITVHVLLLADQETQFLAKLEQFHHTFEHFIKDQLDRQNILKRLKLHRPTLACSFGSVNSTVIGHVKFLAKEEGFFTDPIYSAKLFWEAKHIIHSQALVGNILIVHSGGALTLMGFQRQLISNLN